MNSLRILELETTHIPGALEVIRAHVGAYFYPREIEDARTLFQSVCTGLDSTKQFVAVEDDAVLGTMGYREESGAQGAYNLTYVAVHPEAVRRGVGRALWKTVRDELVQRDARIVYTWTSPLPYTQGPRTFYESLGFSCTAIVPNYWQDGDDLAIFSLRFDACGFPKRGPGEAEAEEG